MFTAPEGDQRNAALVVLGASGGLSLRELALGALPFRALRGAIFKERYRGVLSREELQRLAFDESATLPTELGALSKLTFTDAATGAARRRQIGALGVTGAANTVSGEFALPPTNFNGVLALDEADYDTGQNATELYETAVKGLDPTRFHASLGAANREEAIEEIENARDRFLFIVNAN